MNDNLENAINSGETKNEDAVTKMSPSEEIWFHKGSLNTLVAERNELVKMIGNVDAIIQSHISKLKKLGVNLNE